MTAAAKTPAENYVEDGVTLGFPVRWRYLDPADLVVTRLVGQVPSVLVLGTDYTATTGPTDAGGTLTLLSTVAGASLRIRRVTARKQESTFANTTAFPSSTVESSFDRAMLISQEVDVAAADALARSVRAPTGELLAELPAASGRANALVGFDGTGSQVLYPVGSSLATLDSSATAAETIVVQQYVNFGPLGVRLANRATGIPAHGFAVSSAAVGAPCTVRMAGMNPVTVGAASGDIFLGATAGSWSATPPDPEANAGSGVLLQRLGFAIPGGGVWFQPDTARAL